MSEIVISEFLVTPKLILIDDVKDVYKNNNYIKALCRNKSSFPFLKYKIKKWLPVHFKWISSHCQDFEFLRHNKEKIDYYEVCKNPCINYIFDLLDERVDDLDWVELSKNKNAVPFLIKYQHYIDWWSACQNESMEMMNFLEKNIKYIKWLPLSANPSAIHILKKYINMIDKSMININPKGFEILKENPDLINYELLCSNNSYEAMEMIDKIIKDPYNYNNKYISYELLSANPYAIKILINNSQKIDWFMAIENENIGELFKAFPDKISPLLMKYVVKYPSIIPFLGDYLYDVSLIKLAENPSIFTLDKEDYKNRLDMVRRVLSKIY